MDDDWPGARWYHVDFLAAEREISEKSAAVDRRKLVGQAAEREASCESAVEEM